MASAPRGDPAREVSPQAVAALRGMFRDDLIGVGDPGYENARRVWNSRATGRAVLRLRFHAGRRAGSRLWCRS
jgi:hypothetical protein